MNLFKGAPYRSSGATKTTRAWAAQVEALQPVPVEEVPQELQMASTVVAHLLGMLRPLATMAVVISPGMVLVAVATSVVVAKAKEWAKVEKVAL